MPTDTFTPGLTPNSVRSADGRILTAPEGWVLLPPGDAARLARAITDHATPVGSGTVARTKRIPVEQRAEAAVIAWMRHQTTAYDSMTIPRVKGKRREVRRMLAKRSQELLARYRREGTVREECPLKKALAGSG